MSDQIPVSYAIKFRDDYLLLSQQKRSRLRGTVREDPDYLQGKAGYFERIGATEMQERTAIHQDTLRVDTKHSRRRVTMRDFEWSDLVDRQQLARLMADPRNRYVQNATAAANRKIDDLIIAAARGNAYAMDADDAATATALPSAQKIAVASSGLTLAKILAAKEILNVNEADEDEPTTFVYAAQQLTNILNEPKLTSADYMAMKALTEGKFDGMVLGFKWVRSQRLPKSSTTRYNIAYKKSAIGLAVGIEISVDIGPRRDKGNATQVLLQHTHGATRIEDETVVEIACQET